ncbi:MAG: hypothetical protein ACLQUS_00385 [Desulfobaccales bacterium]
MPRCLACGKQWTGVEPHCSACGQPADAPAPLLEPASARAPHPLSPKNCVAAGWDLFKQYHTGFVGFCLLNFAIQLALYDVLFLGVAASVVVSAPLLMGNFIVSAKLLQGQTPRFRDFFAGLQFFVPLLLLSLIAGLFISIGTVLLIIPGVYLGVAYLFATCLVVDRRLDFWPAMELSRQTITPWWFHYFALTQLLALLNLAGALVLGLGLLVTIPVSFCAMTVAYNDLFGLQSKEY